MGRPDVEVGEAFGGLPHAVLALLGQRPLGIFSLPIFPRDGDSVSD
jgi:hypothetical protein